MTKSIRTALAATALGAGLAFAPTPADAAVPHAFTAAGEARSWDGGKVTTVPNTLYFQRGKIRLEMAAPVSAEGVAPFNVVLAQEGGKTITLLNPKEKQAMKLEMSTLDELGGNPALQKLSQGKITDFAATFKGKSKAVGKETVAGEPCTIREYTGKDVKARDGGNLKVWIADRHDLPLKFAYTEHGKPVFQWTTMRFKATSTLPAASFAVPAGYETTDLSEMLKGVELDVKSMEHR